MVQAYYDYLEYRNSYYSRYYTTDRPNLQWAMDETFYKVMRYRVGISTWLNIQSVIMNFLLLLFLFSKKEFRSWLFFPLMMQATVDIVGPGIANLVFEWKMYFHWPAISDAFDYHIYGDVLEPIISDYQSLQVLYGPFACVLIHLRSLLNEYSTGYCLLATAMFRYLLVCHPNFKLTSSFCKLVAAVLVSIPCVAMIGSLVDLLFNDYGYEINSASSFYGTHSYGDYYDFSM